MARYRLDILADLARQMTYAPPRTRLAQIAAAEELLHSLDPARAYPFDYVLFRITGYRRKGAAGELLTGVALQHDLGLLIERISDSLNIQTAALAEPVLTIDDVSERLGVTSKTIQRWRRRGLPARRFLFPDGKRRVGFLAASVERFFAAHRDQMPAGADFSYLDAGAYEQVLRHARRLAAAGSCCEQEIARRIGRKLNRSPLVILHTLRRYDAEHLDDAIFRQTIQPIPDDDRACIARAFRRGTSLAQLAERFARPRSAIYQALLEERIARLVRRRVRFIDDPLYHDPDAERVVNGLLAAEELASPSRPEDQRVPRDLPPYFQDLYRTPLLTPARERALFLKFNFHKRQFVQARRRLEPQFARRRDVEALESIWRKVAESKNAIIRANLRLVVSVARKHLRPGLNLMELISDGNVTLMRAVESFDVHRGHRFSTYATLALMKGFARSVPMLRAARRSTHEAMLVDVADPRNSGISDRALNRDALRHALGRLNERERTVLRDHYGLGDASAPGTYEQVGRRMGLSKQRVRQIEQTALAKLREQLEP